MSNRRRGFSGEDQRRSQSIVSKRQTRVELERDLELGNGRWILAPEVADAPERAMRAGIIAIERYRVASRSDRVFAVLVVRNGETVDHLVVTGFRLSRIGWSKLGIDGDGLPKQPARLDQARARAAVEMEHAALIDAPGVEIVACLDPRAFTLGAAELRLDRADDRLRYLVLHGKDVGQRAIVAARPDVLAAAAVDQLGADTNLFAGAPHAAREHVAHAKLARDILRVHTSVAVSEGRMPCNDEEPAH